MTTIEFRGVDPDVFAMLYGVHVAAERLVHGTISDLYGLDAPRAFSLYGVDPHCDCDPLAFCRNPLHPGPCKGWKRTLGAVAPGALKALEAERVRKANERRAAAIKRYTDAGQKVPARLRKPITSATIGQQAGAGGPVITAQPSAPTSQQITAKITARRAEVAKIGTIDFMKKKASERLDVYKTLKDADIKAMSPAQRNALDGDLTMMASKFQDPSNKAAAQAIQKRVNAIPAPAAPTPAKATGPRDGDGDGKLREKRKPTGTTPAGPSAPLSPNASAAAKTAHAMANRTAPGARVAKKQVEAYSKLTKAEYDALPDATKDQIKADLADASAKFLDPKKQQQVTDVKAKLGIGSAVVPSSTLPKSGDGSASTPAAPAQAAPAAPAAPSVSPESKQAADVLARLTQLVSGKTLTPREREIAAEGWEAKTPQERADFAKAFADKTLTPLADRLKKTGGVDIGVKGRALIQSQVEDALTGKRKDTPGLDLFAKALERGNTQGRDELEDYLRKEGASSSTFADALNELDAALAKGGDLPMASAIASLASKKRGNEAEFDRIADRLSTDTRLPAWARAQLLTNHSGQAHTTDASASYALRQAVDFAGKPPFSRAYTTTYEIRDLYRVPKKDLDKLHPVVREALDAARAEAVDDQLTATSRGSASRTDVMRAVMGGDPGAVSVDLTEYNKLPDATKAKFRQSMDDWIENLVARNNSGDLMVASSWQSIRDRQDGKDWPDQGLAIERFQGTSATPNALLDAVSGLTKADLDALPDAHALNILERLNLLKGNLDVGIRMKAALRWAELEGNVPKYTNTRTQNAALHAGVWKDVAPADSKYVAFTDLTQSDWDDLNAGGKTAVGVSMLDLANDQNSGLTLDERHEVLHKLLRLNGTWDSYTMDQKTAVVTAKPGNRAKYTEADRLTEYDTLSKADYDGLMPLFRQEIDDDLETLRANNTLAYDRIKAKFDPSYVPPAPVTPTGGGNPRVDAALDVVYGVDPKSRTAARQLTAYGQLRAADFTSLSVQERNVILADLSFIETTSKSADAKARARKYLDRFSPPGTPLGAPAVGTPVPPSGSVSGQTRYPDPAGVPGMLKQASNKGRSGDGWLYGTGGKRVWGKYGAAGLMLRHVDPSTGEERFLMVERGPGISDPGKWQFPGGAIDSKETPAEGATRETIEELGFKATDLDGGRVNGFHESTINGVTDDNGRPWKYTTIAATVDRQIQPDLSSYHARMETSDAKWMTRAEIEALDNSGKLLAPIAGGKLQQNVLSIYPGAAVSAVAAPGPVTRRPNRLPPGQRGANPANPPSASATPYKQRTSTDLVSNDAAARALLDRIKGATRKAYRGKAADERLAAINAIQGNDRTPTVMSKAEMDRLVATGEYIEIWRGVTSAPGKTARQIAEEFRTGPDWGGLGVFGNGYYFAQDRALAEYYAQGGWSGRGASGGLIRALLPKSALTEEWNKVLTEAQRMPSSKGYFSTVGRSGMGGGTLHDEGRYAAAKGLDGVRIKVSDYRRRGGGGHMATKDAYNIVNRSILIVEEAQ